MNPWLSDADGGRRDMVPEIAEIMKRQMKLLIVVNVDWAFITHRLPIAEEAVNKGWKVYVAAKDTGRAKEINNKIEFINFFSPTY